MSRLTGIRRYHMIACIITIAYFLGAALYELGIIFKFYTMSFWDIYLTVTSILSVPYFLTTVLYVPYALMVIIYVLAVVQFINQLKEGSKSPVSIIMSLVTILVCNTGLKCADSMTNSMQNLHLFS